MREGAARAPAGESLLMDKGRCSFGWGRGGSCDTPIRTEAGCWGLAGPFARGDG